MRLDDVVELKHLPDLDLHLASLDLREKVVEWCFLEFFGPAVVGCSEVGVSDWQKRVSRARACVWVEEKKKSYRPRLERVEGKCCDDKLPTP